MKTKVNLIVSFIILFSIFWFGCQEQITEPTYSQLQKQQFTSIPHESFSWERKAADLWAGAGKNDLSRGEDVGDVYIYHEDDLINVDFDIDEDSDWFLIEAHLWISTTPANANNFPHKAAPGKFPYKLEPSSVNPKAHTIKIDPQELELTDPCGIQLFLATHVVIGKFPKNDSNTKSTDEDVEAITSGVSLKDYTSDLIIEGAWGNNENCSETLIDLGVSKKWGWVFCTEVHCPNNNSEWQMYGSNLGTSDEIYRIDPILKTRTLVYNPGTISANQNYPNGNAFDPENQRIYFGTDDGRLFYHQLGSDRHVQVGVGFGQVASGAWYNDKYYYVQNGSRVLYEVSIEDDLATRTIKGMVPTFNRYGDIAFDPNYDGRFIASAGSMWYVYDLNTNTKKILNKAGDGGANHKQLAFAADGILYAVEASTGEFYTVEYSWDDATVKLTSYWDSGFSVTDLASGPLNQ